MTEYQTAELTLRGFEVENRSAHFIASSDAIDSYGERVEQSWNLARFTANPVVLFAHNSRELPIGHADLVEVRDGKLQVRIKFLSEKANPMAEKVWNSIQEKALRAVSVGFVPGSVRVEKSGEREVYVLSDNDLHEISVVPIPANPEALARMKAKAIAAARDTGSDAGGDTAMANETSAAHEAKDRSLAEAQKAVGDLNVKVAELTSKLAESQSREKALVTERDAAVDRAKAAELALCGKDIDELVGVRIAPAEKEGLLELAALDRKLFDKQLAALKQRPDMKLLGGSVIPNTNDTASDGLGQGQALAALLG